MTFLEKAIEQSPQLSADGITTAFCPEELGLEDRSPCGMNGYAPSSDDEVMPCEKCWRREMPHE